MKKRDFGSGRAVSLFTLGTMRAVDSPDQMSEVLETAAQIGINHIETASAYGPAETFIGDALMHRCPSPDGGWVITSKLLPGLPLLEGQRQLDDMLARLGISRLDNLAVHGINRSDHLDWALTGEGAELLDWAESSGRVQQIGFSSHGSTELIERALRSGRFSFCSLHLHMLDPLRLPLAMRALQRGIGVMAISPADKGGRLQAPSPTLVEDCQPVPPLHLAYRFLLAQGVSTLTLGARSADDLQLARQLSHADGPLTEEEKGSLAHLAKKRSERLGNDLCEQCQACLPCPNQVPIPELLRLRNLAIGHDLNGFSQERYNLIGRAGHWWELVDATGCDGCGECLPRCPHQLPIPVLLRDTHQRLAAAPRRRLWG